MMVNSMHNLLPTPDKLRLWGKTEADLGCSLCSKSKCTLLHVLNHFPFALGQGRFTWRHDAVLRLFKLGYLKCVDAANTKTFPRTWCPPIEESFVRAGETWSGRSTPARRAFFLQPTNWKELSTCRRRTGVWSSPSRLLPIFRNPTHFYGPGSPKP